MSKKIIHLPVIFIILCAAVFIVIIKGCTTRHTTYGLAGRPAISADGQFVTVLIAESQATTSRENGGYRSTDYNSTYWLKQYETGTGKLIKKKKIITEAENKNMLVLCYGGYEDKIWLHTNGLTAYDMNSLEEAVNEEKLARQNTFDVNNFPDDQRFIDEKVNDGYIRFTSISGEKYRVNLSDLVLTNEKEMPENAPGKRNAPPGFQMPGKITYGVRNDTLGGKMYILAKDSATAMNSYPGNGDDEPVYKKLYLFRTGYSINNTGNHSFYRYSNMTKPAGPSYLNGVFLKDFATGKVVHMQQPAGYIILHNDSLSNNASSILTAIDENNKIIWQINTGLSTKIADCVVTNKHCIITGNKNYLLGPNIGSDMLCIVDLTTGKLVTPSIEE